MSRARPIGLGLARVAALIALTGSPAGAQSSAPGHVTGAKKAVRVQGKKAVAAPAQPGAAAVPPGSVPMDFTGMDRSVQDVHSESHAHSNSMFNGESQTQSPGVIPNATMKF